MKRSVSVIFVGTAVLALVVLAVAACGGGTDAASTKDDTKALEGKTWQATTIDGLESVLEAKEFAVTAKFAAGQMSGSGTINRYNATYATGPGNTIEISATMSTKMAGPEDAMAQEQAYFAAIQRAATYEVTNDSLILFDDKDKILVEYVVAPDAELTGTEWQVVAYNNGKNALQSLVADSTITATFGEDGSLGGNASINQYSTKYTVSDPDKMTIDPQIATTMMAGPDDLMAQEAAYLAALPKTATYEIDGDTLWLRDAGGAALAQYVAK
jgi:heat shock protein HslJ